MSSHPSIRFDDDCVAPQHVSTIIPQLSTLQSILTSPNPPNSLLSNPPLSTASFSRSPTAPNPHQHSTLLLTNALQQTLSTLPLSAQCSFSPSQAATSAPSIASHGDHIRQFPANSSDLFNLGTSPFPSQLDSLLQNQHTIGHSFFTIFSTLFYQQLEQYNAWYTPLSTQLASIQPPTHPSHASQSNGELADIVANLNAFLTKQELFVMKTLFPTYRRLVSHLYTLYASMYNRPDEVSIQQSRKAQPRTISADEKSLRDKHIKISQFFSIQYLSLLSKCITYMMLLQSQLISYYFSLTSLLASQPHSHHVSTLQHYTINLFSLYYIFQSHMIKSTHFYSISQLIPFLGQCIFTNTDSLTEQFSIYNESIEQLNSQATTAHQKDNPAPTRPQSHQLTQYNKLSDDLLSYFACVQTCYENGFFSFFDTIGALLSTNPHYTQSLLMFQDADEQINNGFRLIEENLTSFTIFEHHPPQFPSLLSSDSRSNSPSSPFQQPPSICTYFQLSWSIQMIQLQHASFKADLANSLTHPLGHSLFTQIHAKHKNSFLHAHYIDPPTIPHDTTTSTSQSQPHSLLPQLNPPSADPSTPTNHNPTLHIQDLTTFYANTPQFITSTQQFDHSSNLLSPLPPTNLTSPASQNESTMSNSFNNSTNLNAFGDDSQSSSNHTLSLLLEKTSNSWLFALETSPYNDWLVDFVFQIEQIKLQYLVEKLFSSSSSSSSSKSSNKSESARSATITTTTTTTSSSLTFQSQLLQFVTLIIKQYVEMVYFMHFLGFAYLPMSAQFPLQASTFAQYQLSQQIFTTTSSMTQMSAEMWAFMTKRETNPTTLTNPLTNRSIPPRPSTATSNTTSSLHQAQSIAYNPNSYHFALLLQYCRKHLISFIMAQANHLYQTFRSKRSKGSGKGISHGENGNNDNTQQQKQTQQQQTQQQQPPNPDKNTMNDLTEADFNLDADDDDDDDSAQPTTQKNTNQSTITSHLYVDLTDDNQSDINPPNLTDNQSITALLAHSSPRSSPLSSSPLPSPTASSTLDYVEQVERAKLKRRKARADLAKRKSAATTPWCVCSQYSLHFTDLFQQLDCIQNNQCACLCSCTHNEHIGAYFESFVKKQSLLSTGSLPGDFFSNRQDYIQMKAQRGDLDQESAVAVLTAQFNSPYIFPTFPSFTDILTTLILQNEAKSGSNRKTQGARTPWNNSKLDLLLVQLKSISTTLQFSPLLHHIHHSTTSHSHGMTKAGMHNDSDQQAPLPPILTLLHHLLLFTAPQTTLPSISRFIHLLSTQVDIETIVSTSSTSTRRVKSHHTLKTTHLQLQLQLQARLPKIIQHLTQLLQKSRKLYDLYKISEQFSLPRAILDYSDSKSASQYEQFINLLPNLHTEGDFERYYHLGAELDGNGDNPAVRSAGFGSTQGSELFPTNPTRNATASPSKGLLFTNGLRTVETLGKTKTTFEERIEDLCALYFVLFDCIDQISMEFNGMLQSMTQDLPYFCHDVPFFLSNHTGSNISQNEVHSETTTKGLSSTVPVENQLVILNDFQSAIDILVAEKTISTDPKKATLVHSLLQLSSLSTASTIKSINALAHKQPSCTTSHSTRTKEGSVQWTTPLYSISILPTTPRTHPSIPHSYSLFIAQRYILYVTEQLLKIPSITSSFCSQISSFSHFLSTTLSQPTQGASGIGSSTTATMYGTNKAVGKANTSTWDYTNTTVLALIHANMTAGRNHAKHPKQHPGAKLDKSPSSTLLLEQFAQDLSQLYDNHSPIQGSMKNTSVLQKDDNLTSPSLSSSMSQDTSIFSSVQRRLRQYLHSSLNPNDNTSHHEYTHPSNDKRARHAQGQNSVSSEFDQVCLGNDTNHPNMTICTDFKGKFNQNQHEFTYTTVNKQIDAILEAITAPLFASIPCEVIIPFRQTDFYHQDNDGKIHQILETLPISILHDAHLYYSTVLDPTLTVISEFLQKQAITLHNLTEQYVLALILPLNDDDSFLSSHIKSIGSILFQGGSGKAQGRGDGKQSSMDSHHHSGTRSDADSTSLNQAAHGRQNWSAILTHTSHALMPDNANAKNNLYRTMDVASEKKLHQYRTILFHFSFVLHLQWVVACTITHYQRSLALLFNTTLMQCIGVYRHVMLRQNYLFGRFNTISDCITIFDNDNASSQHSSYQNASQQQQQQQQLNLTMFSTISSVFHSLNAPPFPPSQLSRNSPIQTAHDLAPRMNHKNAPTSTLTQIEPNTFFQYAILPYLPPPYSILAPKASPMPSLARPQSQPLTLTPSSTTLSTILSQEQEWCHRMLLKELISVLTKMIQLYYSTQSGTQIPLSTILPSKPANQPSTTTTALHQQNQLQSHNMDDFDDFFDAQDSKSKFKVLNDDTGAADVVELSTITNKGHYFDYFHAACCESAKNEKFNTTTAESGNIGAFQRQNQIELFGDSLDIQILVKAWCYLADLDQKQQRQYDLSSYSPNSLLSSPSSTRPINGNDFLRKYQRLLQAGARNHAIADQIELKLDPTQSFAPFSSELEFNIFLKKTLHMALNSPPEQPNLLKSQIPSQASSFNFQSIYTTLSQSQSNSFDDVSAQVVDLLDTFDFSTICTHQPLGQFYHIFSPLLPQLPRSTVKYLEQVQRQGTQGEFGAIPPHNNKSAHPNASFSSSSFNQPTSPGQDGKNGKNRRLLTELAQIAPQYPELEELLETLAQTPSSTLSLPTSALSSTPILYHSVHTLALLEAIIRHNIAAPIQSIFYTTLQPESTLFKICALFFSSIGNAMTTCYQTVHESIQNTTNAARAIEDSLSSSPQRHQNSPQFFSPTTAQTPTTAPTQGTTATTTTTSPPTPPFSIFSHLFVSTTDSNEQRWSKVVTFLDQLLMYPKLVSIHTTSGLFDEKLTPNTNARHLAHPTHPTHPLFPSTAQTPSPITTSLLFSSLFPIPSSEQTDTSSPSPLRITKSFPHTQFHTNLYFLPQSLRHIQIKAKTLTIDLFFQLLHQQLKPVLQYFLTSYQHNHAQIALDLAALSNEEEQDGSKPNSTPTASTSPQQFPRPPSETKDDMDMDFFWGDSTGKTQSKPQSSVSLNSTHDYQTAATKTMKMVQMVEKKTSEALFPHFQQIALLIEQMHSLMSLYWVSNHGTDSGVQASGMYIYIISLCQQLDNFFYLTVMTHFIKTHFSQSKQATLTMQLTKVQEINMVECQLFIKFVLVPLYRLFFPSSIQSPSNHPDSHTRTQSQPTLCTTTYSNPISVQLSHYARRWFSQSKTAQPSHATPSISNLRSKSAYNDILSTLRDSTMKDFPSTFQDPFPFLIPDSSHRPASSTQPKKPQAHSLPHQNILSLSTLSCTPQISPPFTRDTLNRHFPHTDSTPDHTQLSPSNPSILDVFPQSLSTYTIFTSLPEDITDLIVGVAQTLLTMQQSGFATHVDHVLEQPPQTQQNSDHPKSKSSNQPSQSSRPSAANELYFLEQFFHQLRLNNESTVGDMNFDFGSETSVRRSLSTIYSQQNSLTSHDFTVAKLLWILQTNYFITGLTLEQTYFTLTGQTQLGSL